MIALLDPKTWLAAVLVAGISGGLGYWRGHAAGSAAVQAEWNEAKKAAAEAVAQAKDQDLEKGQQASIQYQAERTKHAEQIRIVRQDVVRTVTGPCLDDDGLRHLNAAIGGVSAPAAAR
ncbi:MAG: hypothetical protein Q4A28_07510 [Brachymonas sp.]|nr:hypothetical protein [Brachymonas sp.]